MQWSEEDQEFVGLCAEFPFLSWRSENQRVAFDGIVHLVGECLSGMESSGEALPEPLSRKQYSGKFQVRIPEQHRRLAIAEQGISLNRLASSKRSR